MKTAIIILVIVVIAIVLRPVVFKKQAIVNNVTNNSSEVIATSTVSNGTSSIPDALSNEATSTNAVKEPVKKDPVKTTTKATTTDNVVKDGPKTYTLTEIARHNNSSDCWTTIFGNVYDLTRYADSHPGGEAIYRGCGREATNMYNSVSKHRSSSSLQKLNTLMIGVLEG
jgi:cytochrome b involved in lipid metabolism